MRRPWGSGSIFQRKDGRWIGSVEVPGGVRRRRYATGRTRAEVERKLASLRSSSSSHDHERLDTYLRGWLRDMRPNVRAKTHDGYRNIVERHIIPGLGGHKLPRLTPAHIRQWQRDLVLSPRSKHHALSVLRAALRQAVNDGRLDRSPAAVVKSPQVPHDPIRPLDADQARRFLASLEGDPLEPLYVLALTTGMRQGELLGLRWSDIEADRLTVNRSLTRLRGKFTLAEPKTPQSRRTIPLVPRAIRALAVQREYVRALRIAANLWAEQDLVFCGTDGEPLPNWWVTREFQAALGRAGLPHQRFHDLRHAAASLLIEGGADLAVVRDILGHSTIATTVQVYGHLTDRHKREAVTRLGEMLA